MPDLDARIADAPIGRLKRRADFLRAAKGRRWNAEAATVQASPADPTRDETRIGFTLTKKVGGAVVRNRARRRLKEAVRLSPDLPVEPGRDYVIIGRVQALRLPFDLLRRELAEAIAAVKGAPRRETRARRPEKRPAQRPDERRTRPEP